jgi:hypothetical protein
MTPSPMMAMAVKCFQRLKSNCMNVLPCHKSEIGAGRVAHSKNFGGGALVHRRSFDSLRSLRMTLLRLPSLGCETALSEL